MNSVSCRAILKHSGNLNTIYPTSFDDELLLDIDGVPNLRMRYDPSEYNPSLGETITLLAQKGGSESTIFVGEVTDKREVYSGKTYKWHELEAMSWGKVLLERGTTLKKRAEGSLVIHEIISPLLDEGILSGEDIEYSGKTVEVNFKNEVNLKEALRTLCSPEDKQSQLDYDFRVDFDKVFHAWTRGSKTGTQNLATLATEYDYETTTKGIINSMNVYGKFNKIYGSDSDWFESTVNWHTSDNLFLSTSNKRVGSGAIEASRNRDVSANPIYLRRDFSSPLDLGGGGVFKLRLYHDTEISRSPSEENLYLTLKFRFETSSSDYFELEKTFSKAVRHHPIQIGIKGGYAPSDYIEAVTDWKKLAIAFGPISTDEWKEIGNPDWSSIEHFYLEVVTPKPETILLGGADIIGDNHLILDGGSIITRVHGSYSDSASKDSFGIRKGDDITNTNLKTNEECASAASIIVNAYKDPASYIKNLTVVKNFDASLGWEYPFSDSGISDTLMVRSISHRLQNFDFTTEFQLTDHWIDLPEKMISKFERGIKLTSWKTNVRETEGQIQLITDLSPDLEKKDSYYFPLRTIAPSTGEVGEYYYDEKENKIYRFNGSVWVFIATPKLSNMEGSISDLTDTNVVAPTVTYFAREIDNENTFRTWIEASITTQTGASGYVLSYRRPGESEWIEIQGPQPSSESYKILRTEALEENSKYVCRSCAISKLGIYSDWSSAETVTTLTNDVPPSAPTDLNATALVNGVYFTWTETEANDIEHYNLLRKESGIWNTVDTSKVASDYYHDENYTQQTFCVTAVDTGDNESSHSNTVAVTPMRVDTPNIAVDAIEASLILEGAVGSLALADNAVTTPKLHAGAVTAQKLLLYSIFLDGFTWNNNSPGEGSISWSAGTLTYQGSIVPISAGNTGKKYVFWNAWDTSFSTYDTKPSYADDRFIIALNENGSVRKLWNATYIHGGQIVTESITATEIKSEAVETQHLKTNVITAATPKQNNLAPNPEFEIPDPDDSEIPYYYEKVTEYGSPTYALDSSNSHRGKYSLKMHSTTTDKAAVQLKDAALIPVEEGRSYVFKLKAKASTNVTLGYAIGVIQLYDSSLNYISTKSIEDKNITTSWNEFSVSFSVDTSARYARIHLYNIEPSSECDLWIDDVELKEKTSSDEVINIAADQVIFSSTGNTLDVLFMDESGVTKIQGNRIETGGITADQIAANAVTTNELKFDTLTGSDPSGTGKLWYRYDKDQLRFRGTSSEVGYIPRYPIQNDNTPPENYVVNQSFETDQDEDGIPDFWEIYQTGSGNTISLDSSVSYKGGKSVKLHAGLTTNIVEIKSSLIPVVPSNKYYWSVHVRGSVSANGDVKIIVYFYKADKTPASTTSKILYDGGVFFADTWYQQEGTLSSSDFPSDCRYVRIALRNDTPSEVSDIWYDDVIFSKLRGATATRRTIQSEAGGHCTNTVISKSGAYTTIWGFEVDQDIENLFVLCTFFNPSPIGCTAYVQLVDVTTGATLHHTFMEMVHYYANPVLLAAPQNLNGDSIELQAKVIVGGNTFPDITYQRFSFTPHYHR